VLLGLGPTKAFLVPYSCGATERNGNSISSDITGLLFNLCILPQRFVVNRISRLTKYNFMWLH
jgi:hypothetical protein